MRHKNSLKKLYRRLRSQESKKLLSYAIDDVERETYWETRQGILRKVQRHLNKGDAKEYVEYMLSKPKPE